MHQGFPSLEEAAAQETVYPFQIQASSSIQNSRNHQEFRGLVRGEQRREGLLRRPRRCPEEHFGSEEKEPCGCQIAEESPQVQGIPEALELDLATNKPLGKEHFPKKDGGKCDRCEFCQICTAKPAAA